MATASAIVETPVREVTPSSRIVFTQGGKGGVGKTAFSTLLVEWYATQGAPLALIDMDSENKDRGSLAHFFPQVRKVNIQRARGLDDFIDVLDEGSPIVVADMGAGAGEVAHQWFDAMHAQAADNGVSFTSIGIITPDPASVSSVLSWGNFLQDRVSYIVVKNSISNPSDFSYWENDSQTEAFRREFMPQIISMEYRLAEIEHEAREHGLTLQAVAERKTKIPSLSHTASVWRAQAYRRNLFAELNRVKDLLLL
jgi:MinD-like ATPase involved in chromosome partitioning or flagellar assembly